MSFQSILCKMKAKTQYNNGQPQLRHETKINSVQRANPDKQWW